MDYKELKTCRVCNSPRLHKYLDLGQVPLANSLVTFGGSPKPIYPIQMMLCLDCALSQLSVVVDPKLMFTDYVYHSSVSKTFQKHCYDMAVSIRDEFKFQHPLVMDIASNDGCLLDQFRLAGFDRLMGIEPAKNLTTTYLDRQFMVVNEFFSQKLVNLWDGGKVSVITATNVLAHVDNLYDFVGAIKYSLTDNGICVIEVPYFNNLLHNNQYDTIYHEHLSYFLLNPLYKLFKLLELPIFRVEHHPIHGGSLRIYASKNAYEEELSVVRMLQDETDDGLFEAQTYDMFSHEVNRNRERLHTLLELLHHSDKKVVGYGASAKGISLLNYSGIDNKWIQAIVDETPEKQDKMTPGTNIPIVDFESFNDIKPDYILLLAWNFAEELKSKTKHLKSNYITPIPVVMIT